jgi:O-acetylhomoserine/O-acetylserine sulfhydrylase-like pyridoxal-dependent enzyme
MSIVQTQTTSFKKELYQGIHDLLTDEIRIALYTAQADLNADTTVYSTTNEITGTGYSQGGEILQNATVQASGTTAYVSFSNVTWNPAVFTTRCALIYNVTKGNKSVAVLDFGSDKTASNTFTITMPANTPSAALIRSSY